MLKYLIPILFSTLAFAQVDTFEGDHLRLLKKYKITPSKEQAYCYSQNEEVRGYQVDKLQRMASLTKIFTTLQASELLDLHKKYTTTFYISDDELFIKGGLDPYFEEDKILLLFKDLNRLGYKKFKRVTFDDQFWFYDLGLSTYEPITPAKTLARLKFYLNPRNRASVRSAWNTVLNFAEEENVFIDKTFPELTATTVTLAPSGMIHAPFAREFNHTSMPLHRLIKSMNVMSKNHVAQNIFLEASKIKSMKQLLIEKKIPESTFAVYNGSGLPMETPAPRKDNLSSCRTVLQVMKLLETSLEKHKLNLSDVMALTGGKDLGSFRGRFNRYPEATDTIFAKTGTLKHSSSLAGFILSSQKIPFAVLNHTPNVASARSFQDEFVATMLQSFEPLSPFPYLKISIFPWDGSDFLTENL